MSHLADYIAHHPYLAGGALLCAVLVLINELRERAQSFGAVSAMQAVQLMNQGALLLDVRGREAFEAGHIGEARNVSLAELASQADSLKKWKERNVIVYCDTGMSAGGAVKTLTGLGFAKVFNLAGGIESWRKENLPIVKSAARRQDA